MHCSDNTPLNVKTPITSRNLSVSEVKTSAPVLLYKNENQKRRLLPSFLILADRVGFFLIFAKHKCKLFVCALQKSSVTAKNSPPDCFLNAASSPVFIILHKKDTVKVSFCVVEHTGLDSRLRARSAPALTCHRHVIHYRGPSSPTDHKEKSRNSDFFLYGAYGTRTRDPNTASVVRSQLR